MAKTFVAYSRDDSGFALKLANDLRHAGADVWIDQLDILPGEPWDRAVQQALQDCGAMIVILSPASVASDNVMDEVNSAREDRKRIIPIIHRACDIPYRLRRPERIDFPTLGYDAGLSRLLEALEVASRTPPQEPTRPIRRFLRHVWTYVAHVGWAPRTIGLLATLTIIVVVAYFKFCPSPPPPPFSRPIGIWFSTMGDNNGPGYLPDETTKAKMAIESALDVFERLYLKPNRLDPNRVVLNVVVGCYKAQDPGENKLAIRIPEVSVLDMSESYQSADPNSLSSRARYIAGQIRERILQKYPLRGEIFSLQASTQVLPGHSRTAHINLGSDHGVRVGDNFEILDPNSARRRRLGLLEVTRTYAKESDAKVTSGGEEIDEYCPVERTRRDRSD